MILIDTKRGHGPRRYSSAFKKDDKGFYDYAERDEQGRLKLTEPGEWHVVTHIRSACIHEGKIVIEPDWTWRKDEGLFWVVR